MKIKKVEKLVTNLHDKTEYVIHKRNLNPSIKSLIFLAWLKPYIKLS